VTDSKLRELERRWKESGSVEDEAAYLLERVRVGDLEQEKLELAAYFGHEAARRASSGKCPPNSSAEIPDEWGAWLSAIPARECPVQQVRIRAALACARLCTALYPAPASKLAVSSAEDWVLCPCPQHARSARELSERALPVSPEDIPFQALLPIHAAAWAAVHAARVASSSLGATAYALDDCAEALEMASFVTSQGEVLTAIRREITPWLLGNGDPIQQRASMRTE